MSPGYDPDTDPQYNLNIWNLTIEPEEDNRNVS